MVKVKVISKFTLQDYKKLKNVVKVKERKENEFDVGDTFICDEEMTKYLTGDNVVKMAVVEVLEVIPEPKAVKEVKEEPEIKEEKIVKKSKKIKKR